MSIARWYQKADALSEAWAQEFGAAPLPSVVSMCLGIAEHETQCGDAWPGSHNWGACTVRGPTAAERAAWAAAGVHPVLSPAGAREAAEKAAMDVLAQAQIDPGKGVTLHVDSAPESGPYFTWFGAFDDDVAGARYFVHILATQHPITRSTLERGGSAYAVAAAMYQAGYFTGFYLRHGWYVKQGGKWVQTDSQDDDAVPGSQLNTQAYGDAVSALLPAIQHALVAWVPGATPPSMDLSDPVQLQAALNKLGAHLTVDGMIGPLTKSAITDFQRQQGLPETGGPDPDTLAALLAALKRAGF